MIFNDPNTTTKKGLVQDAYFMVNADSVSYPIADVTRAANSGLDTVFALILTADGKWQFDDKNMTDLPIGTTALVADQQDYSFNSEYAVIKSIECQDQNGNWKRLIPIDNDDLAKTQAMSQFANVSGNPVYYDKMGDSILLYPAPNYSQAGSLRAYFQRNMSYFETTDTDKEPGFVRHLHPYISLCIQYAYAKAKGLAKLVSIKKDMIYYEGNTLEGGNDKGAIAQFYSYREVDRRPKISNNVRVKR